MRTDAPWPGLDRISSLPWCAAFALCAAQVAMFSRRIGAFRWLSAALYPVPLVFFFVVFAWSVARAGKTVRWKGRELRAD